MNSLKQAEMVEVTLIKNYFILFLILYFSLHLFIYSFTYTFIFSFYCIFFYLRLYIYAYLFISYFFIYLFIYLVIHLYHWNLLIFILSYLSIPLIYQYLGACVMVGHLRGRQLNPVKIKFYKADISQRLLKLKEDSKGNFSISDFINSIIITCFIVFTYSSIYLFIYLFIY